MDDRALEQSPKVTVRMPDGTVLQLGGNPTDHNQGGNMKDPEPG